MTISINGTLRVVAEPRVKQTKTEWAVVTMRVVIQKKNNGEYQSMFLNVKFWTKNAAVFQCKKGDDIAILNGVLEEEKWIDKTTQLEKNSWSIVTWECTVTPKLSTPRPSQSQVKQEDWGDSPFEEIKPIDTTTEGVW